MLKLRSNLGDCFLPKVVMEVSEKDFVEDCPLVGLTERKLSIAE